MNTVQLIQVTPEQIQAYVKEAVSSLLEDYSKKFIPEKQPEDFLTRQDVADKFRVNLSTIHNWVKAGKLKQYGIGNRVYFRRSEVDESLVLLNRFNNKGEF